MHASPIFNTPKCHLSFLHSIIYRISFRTYHMKTGDLLFKKPLFYIYILCHPLKIKIFSKFRLSLKVLSSHITINQEYEIVYLQSKGV